MVALKAEALPIIEFYNLKKNLEKNKPFTVYENPLRNILLIISGIGNEKSYRAVLYLQQLFPYEFNSLWINLGLGGHRDHQKGKIYEIKKVINNKDNQTFYTNTFLHNFKVEVLCSVEKAETVFTKNNIYDMEGFGFISALEKKVQKDYIFNFKIVSDNLTFQPKSYKDFAYRYIKKYIKSIHEVLEKYLSYEENNIEINNLLKVISNKYHITFYNRKKIESLIKKILIIQNKNLVEREIIQSSSLNQLINLYEDKLNNYLLKI